MEVVCRGLFFLLLVLGGSCYDQDIDLSEFSRAILSMTNDTLGVGKMQEHFASLTYTKMKKNISANQVADQISRVFKAQQSALEKIKERVEQVYGNGIFTARDFITECCNVVNLTDNYEFGLPISVQQTCDRISGIASTLAESVYGFLDSTFEENQIIPLKWQYFGSEKGILNQYPSSRPSDCSSYDNRFRPWYKASATPTPKDVVIVIKNNPLPHTSRLFEAADIILRTLNPRDRVAMVIYNDEILKNVIGGCYATNLSLATPANVNLFQNFLKTAPDPKSGNRMSLAMEAAYTYYDLEMNLTDGAAYNSTTRDRAIVVLTDGHRLTDEEQVTTKIVVKMFCTRLPMVSVFLLYTYSNEARIPSDVRAFLEEVAVDVDGGKAENVIQIDPMGDLRESIKKFYAVFASKAQHSSVFKPVFMVPYYDVFGLEQLVMTLSTPCYSRRNRELLGVASVDLTVSDMFASAEHFTQGDFSYAFVIDEDGLVLYHPLLPYPSTKYAAVYLDISTLEPRPAFEAIRQSMISGGNGCKELESHVVLSRGRSEHHGSHVLNMTSNYCWASIEGTPFSLCVVVPKDAYDCQYSAGSFTPPIKAHYHLLDILVAERDLCRRVGQYATTDNSTVVLFPEAFEQYSHKIGDELKREAHYIQEALVTFKDPNQLLKTHVLESVAATARAEEVWHQLDSHRGNDNHGNDIHDYVAWRYVGNSMGVVRIYPGTQLDTTGLRVDRYPWYQGAVSDVNSISISPPHTDYCGTGHTISLSKAIVRSCLSGEASVQGIQCGIEVVMGMDIAHGHFMTLLTKTVNMCQYPERYRCMVIDSNAYVITHPKFFSEPESIENNHLSALEPFLIRDMYRMGYIGRVYCNNFQYNYQFTKRPRKQFSYEVTNMVRMAETPLEGGYITRCVFYKIAPVAGTNAFFIAVDVERSSKPLCTPVSCPCNPGQPCSNLPSDCTCPCVEEIPPENYNSCLESFTGLCAPACPTRTGFLNASMSKPTMRANSSVRVCYPQNCTAMKTALKCLSFVNCELCLYDLGNGSTISQCEQRGNCSPNITTGTNMNVTSSHTNSATEILVWQCISGFLFVISILSLLLCLIHYVKLSRRNSKVQRVDTTSTNMFSVTDEGESVLDSLKRQDSSQEQSCSSQEVKASSNPTVVSIVTFGTLSPVPADNGGTGGGGGKEGGRGTGDDIEGVGRRGEGEGMCMNDDLQPAADDPFETDRKTDDSFPDSVGTNGLHDMLSKLGESPDPSKAGGIWF